MRLCVVLLLFAGLVGCGSEAALKGTPVSISGKVLQGGRPCGGLVMIFQPLGDGHVGEFPIGKDGSFNGKLVSGEYAYYVAKPRTPGVAQMAQKLSPKFLQADLSRTVTVEPDKLLAIALD
jgi:hypothetical protein